MFKVDEQLLFKAHNSLFKRNNLYWIIGGACSGKSTISRAISETKNISLYDMDKHIYGSYSALYGKDRHPANKTWLSATNPLDFLLSLSPQDFNAFNQAANAEYFDLLSDDLVNTDSHQPLLIDGGITHPSLLVKIIPRANIFCIDISEARRVRTWETSEDRGMMKEWIFDLPNPQEKWKKFLEFDKLIAETITAECRTNNIKLFSRDEATSIQSLAAMVIDYFGI